MTTRTVAADLHAIDIKLADRRAALADARADEDRAHQIADLEFDIELLTKRAELLRQRAA